MTKKHDSVQLHSLNYYLKSLIKFILGEKNTNRLRKIKRSIKAAQEEFSKSDTITHQTEREQKILSMLTTAHQIEKALVMNKKYYLETMNYAAIIQNISQLISSGKSPESFAVCEIAAVMKTALATLEGHEDEKEYKIPDGFRGGCEKLLKTDIHKHLPANEEWRNFVKSRHSVRRFTKRIIDVNIIHEIISDAEYYPSACNRQPCKVYYSQDKETISAILKFCDNFVTGEGSVHNCFIITSDRALFHKSN